VVGADLTREVGVVDRVRPTVLVLRCGVVPRIREMIVPELVEVVPGE
jgi:hypothetical protein